MTSGASDVAFRGELGTDCSTHLRMQRERGWRTFKRPGATEFLEQLAPYYEIVVFSDQLNLVRIRPG